MPLLDTSRVLNNLLVLGILGFVFFLIYSKMDKEKMKATFESIKGFFANKKEGK